MVYANKTGIKIQKGEDQAQTNKKSTTQKS